MKDVPIFNFKNNRMTNNQKEELLTLIDWTGNPYELIAISKTLNVLTVAPLDDNEREVYERISKRMENMADAMQQTREDLQAEAEQERRDEIYDNVTVNGEGDE